MPGLNKRSNINMNGIKYTRNYPFINFIKAGQFVWNAAVDTAQIDADGYITDNSQVLGTAQGIILTPRSSEYAGKYVLKWTGTGTVWLSQGYVWTYDAASSSGATELSVGSGRFSGTNPRIVVTPVAYPGDIMTIDIKATDPSNVGDHVRDLKFYMITDEADLNAGKIYRRSFKQMYVDFNPGCIRPLNWNGGGATLTSKWSSQLSPTNISFVTGYAGLLPYGTATVTPLSNAMSVNSVAGMPVTYQHGEIVACSITGSTTVLAVRTPVSNITNATQGVVTCAGHPFAVGHRLIFQICQGQTPNFHQLHYKVCTVVAVTTNTFTIDVNTTTFGAFPTGGTGYAHPAPAVSHYYGLNVGSRGERPILVLNGNPSSADSGQSFDGGYGHFIYDKYLVGNRDLGPGAWVVFNANTANYIPHEPGVPIEITVALVNELDEMKQEQFPGSGGINLWVCIPPRAMMSVDPDYTAAENWPVKCADLALNGRSGSARA